MHSDPLSHIEYQPALLTALFETGGARSRSEAIERVGELLHQRFGAADFEKRQDGRLNWEYRVDWVKNKLVNDGLMERRVLRGFWRLTDDGYKEGLTAAASFSVH